MRRPGVVGVLQGMGLEVTGLCEVAWERVWYLLKGMVFTSALASTLTGRDLQPCLVKDVTLCERTSNHLGLYLCIADLLMLFGKREWML